MLQHVHRGHALFAIADGDPVRLRCAASSAPARRRSTTSAAGTASGSIGTGTVSSGTDTATLTISGTGVWAGDHDLVPVRSRRHRWLRSTPASLSRRRAVNQELACRGLRLRHCNPDLGRTVLLDGPLRARRGHLDSAGVDPADDNGVGECFNVAPVTPTLPTSATCSASTCVLGSILTDTAFLSSGAATQPGTNGADTDFPSINADERCLPPAASVHAGGLYDPGCGCTHRHGRPTPTYRDRDRQHDHGLGHATRRWQPTHGTYTFVANYVATRQHQSPATVQRQLRPGAKDGWSPDPPRSRRPRTGCQMTRATIRVPPGPAQWHADVHLFNNRNCTAGTAM